MNDIFRYLKDEEDEIVDDEPTQPEVPAEEPPTPADGHVLVEEHADDVVVTEPAAEQVDEKLEEQKATVNEPESTDVNSALAAADAEESVVVPESSSITDETVGQTTESVADEQPAEPEATAAPTASAEATPSAPEAPPAKKTWASMLGGGGVKAPAIPALPVSAPAGHSKSSRPVQASQTPKAAVDTTVPAANTATSTPTSQSNGWQTADHSKKGKAGQNKPSEGVVLAYIKNVNEKVDARILREVLESFGELKYFDVSRQRVSDTLACMHEIFD